MESSCGHTCGGCSQEEELLCLVAELQEEVGKLRSIWESKKEVDEWSCALQFLVYVC